MVHTVRIHSGPDCGSVHHGTGKTGWGGGGEREMLTWRGGFGDLAYLLVHTFYIVSTYIRAAFKGDRLNQIQELHGVYGHIE